MMKIVLFVVACLIATTFAATLSTEQYRFLFTRFVEQYNKQYETNDIFSRFEIFKSNLDLIVAHNAQQLPWKMAVNEFADYTTEEFNRMMGFKAPQSIQDSLPADVSNAMKNIKLQATYSPVDWREKNVVNAVKNQASCGSCWAFGAVAPIESQYAIDFGKLYDLSEQELVDCATECSGCNGGLPAPALDGVKRIGGLCLSTDYPYTARDGKCKSSECKPVVKVLSYQSVPKATTLENHKSAIQSGLVNIGIAASSSAFQFYSSGILTKCSDQRQNHSVVIVGYGTDATVGDYFVIRNSWGASWGEAGYIRIAATTSGICGLGVGPYDVGHLKVSDA